MRRVRLAHGQAELKENLPRTEGFRGILTTRDVPVLPEPIEALECAMTEPIASAPLAEVVQAKTRKTASGASAVVLISAVTRPVPNAVLLPPMLRILEQNGISRDDIAILVATMIHGLNTVSGR